MKDIKKVLDWRNHCDGFNQLLGLAVEDIWDGGSRVTLQMEPKLLNPMGNAHGGTIYALCDAAAGSAALFHGYLAVTLTGSINYLSPGKPAEKLCAVTTERKHGRQTGVYEVEVTDSTGRCIATANFTMFYTNQKVEDLVSCGCD